MPEGIEYIGEPMIVDHLRKKQPAADLVRADVGAAHGPAIRSLVGKAKPASSANFAGK